MEHKVRVVRYVRGHSPIGNRKLYGYELRCPCGWTDRCNESKSEATSRAKAHVSAQAQGGEG